MVQLKELMAEDIQEPREIKTHGPSVLVAEDEKSFLRLMKVVLEKAGISAKYVETQEDAEKLIEEGAFDVILTDKSLDAPTDEILERIEKNTELARELLPKDTGGYDVAQAAKRKNPNTQVIMVTGSASTITPEIKEQYGIDTVVQKNAANVLKLSEHVREAYEIKKALDLKGTS